MSDAPTMNLELATPPGLMLPAAGDRSLSVMEYKPGSILSQLFCEPGAFDFFQAVSLIERASLGSGDIGRVALPSREPLKFRAAIGSAFPRSAICEILPPTTTQPQAEMTVALMGLTGPSGVLPRHYTELIHRIQREARGSERHALRDWFDLFNHRLLSIFYRAWDKHRPWQAYARGETTLRQPDTLTTAIFSFAGLGLPELRDRLKVTSIDGDLFSRRETTLAEIHNLSLARYSGLLAQRPRTASNLQQLVGDYFSLPTKVEQFRGQWLDLEPAQQTQLSLGDANNGLGTTATVGSRVWDVNSKFRLQLGPLTYQQFTTLLPSRSATSEGKAFHLLCHLMRLFAGPEFDFDVQLVLQRDEVPPCQLTMNTDSGPRLGWNTWLGEVSQTQDAADAVFESDEVERIETSHLVTPAPCHLVTTT
jgi:type VI secretion system protein ImpH